MSSPRTVAPITCCFTSTTTSGLELTHFHQLGFRLLEDVDATCPRAWRTTTVQFIDGTAETFIAESAQSCCLMETQVSAPVIGCRASEDWFRSNTCQYSMTLLQPVE